MSGEDSSAKEAPQPEEKHLIDSKRLKLFMSAIQGCNEKITEDIKEMIAKIYRPVFVESPHQIEKIQKGCVDTYLKMVNRRVNKFIESNELDKKLVELEDIASNPVPGVEKAWRPTGLSVMQQQLAQDTEVKMNVKERLEKELEKEEAELKEIMVLATKYREQYRQLEEKVAGLKKKVDGLLDKVEENFTAMQEIRFPETA